MMIPERNNNSETFGDKVPGCKDFRLIEDKKKYTTRINFSRQREDINIY